MNDNLIIQRLKKRYLVHDSIFKFINVFCDIFLSHKEVKITQHPKKILFVNLGHIGDAIISTGVIDVLKKSFPNSTIDLLINPESEIIFDKTSFSSIFYLNHWYLSRTSSNFFLKLAKYFFDALKLSRVIRKNKYDVAIDVRAWFPNAGFVLWLSSIPIRIGYKRAALSIFFNISPNYVYDRRHELHHQLDLLVKLGVSHSLLTSSSLFVPVTNPKYNKFSKNIVFNNKKIHVLHMAASTSTRDAPQALWEKIAFDCLKNGVIPLCTGKGARDYELASAFCAAVPGVLNAVNQFNWAELTSVISDAELIYSVETSVGHLAAALNRPVISIYGGFSDDKHWRPYGDRVIVVKNQLPCDPCFSKFGCNHKACLKFLDYAEISKARKILIGW